MDELTTPAFLPLFLCRKCSESESKNDNYLEGKKNKIILGLRVNAEAQESRGVRELLTSPESGFNIPRKKHFRIWLKHSG